MTTPVDIDDLLATPKTLAGTVEWREEGNSARLTAPVMLGATVKGDLAIRITATTHTSPQRGSIALVYEGNVITRASFMPGNPHANDNKHPTPVNLRFQTLSANTSRLYAWADDRQWPRDANRRMAARQMDPQPATLAQAIDSFLAQCNITAVVPNAPWRPELFG